MIRNYSNLFHHNRKSIYYMKNQKEKT
uniref:Uncharacterized protein n=1 Tax=Arundo donax TaxID=35708 RepID=A0A0A9H5M0_ARUDO